MNEDQEGLAGCVQLAGGGKIEALGDCHDSLNGSIQDSTSKMLQAVSTVGIMDSGVKNNSENEEEDMQETVDNGTLDCEEQEEGNQEHEFTVGEFVWAKTLSCPWWPGQIYDPADASKDTAMYNRKDRLLVVFFGKEKSAWCYPSQVKPFQEIFHQMSMQGNPSSFCSAVKEALSRIGRYVEREMTCSCVTLEILKGLARPLALNSGVMKGVVEPEGKMVGLSALEFEPAKFLAHLQCFAQAVYGISPFELIVFQSQLTAFNRANRWCPSRIYLELQGDSDCMRDDGCATVENDVNCPTRELFLRPSEAGRTSVTVYNNIERNSSAKSIHQKKRPRTNDPLALALRKRKKNKDFESGGNGDQAEDGSSSSKLVSGSKQQERPKPSGSDSTFQNSEDHTLQNDGNGALVQNRTGSLCRERKKSKYLSPPYTMLSRGYKSLLSLKDNVPNSVNVSKTSQPKKSVSRGRGIIKQQSNAKLKKVEINMEACDILSELYIAAMDPMYLKESSKDDQIKGFFLYMRNHQGGSDCQKTDEGGAPQYINVDIVSPEKYVHKTYYPWGKCKKKRDLKEEAGSQISQNKIDNRSVASLAQDTPESNGLASEGSSQMDRQDGTEAATVQMSEGKLFDIKVCSPEECVHKTDGSTSKGRQQKRGRRKKKKDSASEGLQIKVETAASIRNKKTQNSRASKNKGSSQYITTPFNSNATIPPSAVTTTAQVPPLQVVRRNLENMTLMLKKAGDRLSPDVKANLENEIKRLLQKVEMVT